MITAIIPTYKRPHLLKRAVKSVLNQTYPHFTLLIADNASGPETDTVVEGLMAQDSRIKWLKQPTNLGMAGNFHSALAQVTTPYFCILPDDDFYAPTFFEETMAAFVRHPDIAFAGGGGELFIDQNHNVLVRDVTTMKKRPETGYYTAPKALMTHFLNSSGIQLPPTLFKTSCVHEVGGFDTRLKFCLDTDIIAKCAGRFPVYLITDRILYFYFLHNGSFSHSFDLKQQEIEAHYLHETVLQCPLAPSEHETLDLWHKEWKQRICSKLYGEYYEQREFRKAYEYAKKTYALTQSSRWRSRKTRARLYSFFPPLFSLYHVLNILEKKFRSTPAKPAPPCSPYKCHPDSAKWKEYALSLLS